MTLRQAFKLAPVLLAAALCGCVQSQLHVGSDFGIAVRQDVAAQIANPRATYPSAVTADGPHAALALDRYQTGKVIQPVSAAASTIGAASASPGAAPK